MLQCRREFIASSRFLNRVIEIHRQRLLAGLIDLRGLASMCRWSSW